MAAATWGAVAGTFPAPSTEGSTPSLPGLRRGPRVYLVGM